MPRSVKVTALLTFGLAILLFPFFEICKHAPALSLVNAFAEDPYDAVYGNMQSYIARGLICLLHW
jgi:hypothetical protein